MPPARWKEQQITSMQLAQQGHGPHGTRVGRGVDDREDNRAEIHALGSAGSKESGRSCRGNLRDGGLDVEIVAIHWRKQCEFLPATQKCIEVVGVVVVEPRVCAVDKGMSQPQVHVFNRWIPE